MSPALARVVSPCPPTNESWKVQSDAVEERGSENALSPPSQVPRSGSSWYGNFGSQRVVSAGPASTVAPASLLASPPLAPDPPPPPLAPPAPPAAPVAV